MNQYSPAQRERDADPLCRKFQCSDIDAAKQRHRWRSAGSGAELQVPSTAPTLDRAMRSTGPPPVSTNANSALFRRSDPKRKPKAAGRKREILRVDLATDCRQV